VVLKARTVLALLLLLAAACTGSQPAPTHAAPASTPSTPSMTIATDPFSPRNAHFVGTIRAPEPPANDTDLFKAILLSAYETACRSVLNVQAQIRGSSSPRSILVVVRCDGSRTRSVRVVYTGVTVPDLIGQQPGMNFLSIGNLLGLKVRLVRRPARSGERSGTIVSQTPPAGKVVPFGTMLTAVLAA